MKDTIWAMILLIMVAVIMAIIIGYSPADPVIFTGYDESESESGPVDRINPDEIIYPDEIDPDEIDPDEIDPDGCIKMSLPNWIILADPTDTVCQAAGLWFLQKTKKHGCIEITNQGFIYTVRNPVTHEWATKLAQGY